MEENIKSPFWGNTNEKFIEEMDVLIKKYGFHQFFIAFSEPMGNDEEIWNAFSNVMSEGMADYLEESAVPHIRTILEDNK